MLHLNHYSGCCTLFLSLLFLSLSLLVILPLSSYHHCKYSYVLTTTNGIRWETQLTDIAERYVYREGMGPRLGQAWLIFSVGIRFLHLLQIAFYRLFKSPLCWSRYGTIPNFEIQTNVPNLNFSYKPHGRDSYSKKPLQIWLNYWIHGSINNLKKKKKTKNDLRSKIRREIPTNLQNRGKCFTRVSSQLRIEVYCFAAI